MQTLFANLTECIAPQLAAVETLFEHELASDLAPISSLVKHVSRFRGKMLRPCLLLLSGQACGKLTPQHVVLATVVEMIHMSTLVHDDVLDEAELRRRGATINHLRGNEAAVLLGDYLISHSYHLCATLDDPVPARHISRATNRVCEGELLQLHNRNNLDLPESQYLDIIDRKTAALCAVCCRVGAYCSAAPESHQAALEHYARSLGIAFQIQDDILDLTGQIETVGKTLGTDIEKGKLTLPMIHFLKSAPARHRDLLRSLLSSRDADKAERIRNLILPSDSIAYAQDRAQRYIAEASAALEVLPATPARSTLQQVAALALSRSL